MSVKNIRLMEVCNFPVFIYLSLHLWKNFFLKIFVLLTYESNLGNYIDFLCDILGIYILPDSPLIGKS